MNEDDLFGRQANVQADLVGSKSGVRDLCRIFILRRGPTAGPGGDTNSSPCRIGTSVGIRKGSMQASALFTEGGWEQRYCNDCDMASASQLAPCRMALSRTRVTEDMSHGIRNQVTFKSPDRKGGFSSQMHHSTILKVGSLSSPVPLWATYFPCALSLLILAHQRMLARTLEELSQYIPITYAQLDHGQAWRHSRNPCIAQQPQHNRMTLVVQWPFLLGVDEC